MNDSSNDPVHQQRLSERKFMHDLAGPIGAALLSIDVALEEAREQQKSEIISPLETVHKALEEITRMLRARRELLINASGGPGAAGKPKA